MRKLTQGGGGGGGCALGRQVKDKTARKINFAQFDHACHLLADAKGISYDEFVAKALAAGGPGKSGVTEVAHDGILSKLTDTSLYTGAHKERFDADGKGRGIAGREQATGTADLSAYVSLVVAAATGYTLEVVVLTVGSRGVGTQTAGPVGGGCARR